MAELCVEVPVLGLRLFQKPFTNNKGRAAASLAAEGGAVQALLRRHAAEKRKAHEEAEERQRQARPTPTPTPSPYPNPNPNLHPTSTPTPHQAGTAPDSIDSLLKTDLSVGALLELSGASAWLATMPAAAKPGAASAAEPPASTAVVEPQGAAAAGAAAAGAAAAGAAAAGAAAAGAAAAGAAAAGAAAAGAAAPSKPASRTPARHLLLARQLRFGEAVMQVALTRHCLMQLQMLDVPRRAAALRLLHGLGSKQLENQEALEAEGLEGSLFYSHSDLRRRLGLGLGLGFS